MAVVRELVVGEAMVLAPVGPLERAAWSELERRASELIGEGREHFVVDLGQIDDIESSGLRALLTLDQKLRNSGGALVLCSLRGRTRQAFEVSQFDRVFVITDSRDAALRLLPGSFSTITGLAAKFLDLEPESMKTLSPVAAPARVHRREEILVIADLAASLLAPVPEIENALALVDSGAEQSEPAPLEPPTEPPTASSPSLFSTAVAWWKTVASRFKRS